jgi:glycosyltransferase involved in cell wall biosynthesis
MSEKIFVIGAGVQNKVLESMALGKPVVATSRAIQGLNIGVEGTHFLKADSEDEFFHKISYLIDNDRIRREIGINGKLLVRKYFTWDNIEKKLLDILTRTLKTESDGDKQKIL